MFALDSYKLEGVTASNLDRLVTESGGLAAFIETFTSGGMSVLSSFPIHQMTWNLGPRFKMNPRLLSLSQSPNPNLPLLLWVDDNPHYNTEHLRRAEEQGIHVVVITSTASAKEWIDGNLGMPQLQLLSADLTRY